MAGIIENESLLLEIYTRLKEGDRVSDDCETMIEHLDKIETDVVGRINVSRLFAETVGCVNAGLKVILPDGHKDATDVSPRAQDEQPRNRGTPRFDDSGAVSRRVSRVVEHVAQSTQRWLHSNLGSISGELYNRLSWHEQQRCTLGSKSAMFEVINIAEAAESPHYALLKKANVFVVDKSRGEGSPVYRFVTDVRIFNEWVSMKPFAGMSIFSIEDVVRIVSTLSHEHEKFFVVQCDFRHFFFQIPLPQRLWKFFAVPHADGKRYFLQKVLPMGASFSCFIAQCVTYGALLSVLKNPDGRAGKLHKLGIAEETWAVIEKLDVPPPWIPLIGGGGVFVIMDDVFVITEDANVKTAWARHIRSVTDTFGILRKKLKDELGKPTDVDIRTTTLERGNETSCEVLGIKFKHGSARVECGKKDMELLVSRECITFRQWHRLLGLLLWMYRVYSIARSSAIFLSFAKLYTTTPVDGSQAANWKFKVVGSCAQADYESLRQHWQSRWRDRNNWRPLKSVAHINFASEGIVRCAVDASSTEAQWAYVVFNDTSPRSLVPYVPSPHQLDGMCSGIEPGAPEQGGFNGCFSWAHGRHDYTSAASIAFAEMLALKEAVAFICETFQNVRAIEALSDSSTVRGQVKKNVAPSETANGMLKEIDELLNSRFPPIQLWTVRIESANNVADCLTRLEDRQAKHLPLIDHSMLLSSAAALDAEREIIRTQWMKSRQRRQEEETK